MKKLCVIIVSICLISCSWPEKRKYCGVVTEKFRTDAGYKSHPEAHIVFYCDSLRRNVDVEVTWNTYANAQPGDQICFELTERSLNY